MTELYKFTHNAFRWLTDNIPENKAYYEDPKADFGKLLQKRIGEYREPAGITVSGEIELDPPKDISTNKRHLADRQALDFYRALEGMTPRLATEPETLAYLNHMYLHEYGVARWPQRGSSTFEANIQQHWLTASNQKTAIYKSSVSGRTWWIAHLATVAAEASNGAFDANQALDVFVKDPEYYHRTMEYMVLRNPTMMAECVRSLRNEARGINRTGYREMAQEINREAGARLLDSLTQADIRELVRRAADRQMCRTESVSGRQFLKGVKKFKVLSLGAGTQSTVLALMAEEGWGGLEKPDMAIFADTQWEPPHVYEHLDWLEKQLSYRVIRVSAGSIRENVLDGVTPDGNRFLDMPVFLINADGTKSVAARQCTAHYKINPIHRGAPEDTEAGARQARPHGHAGRDVDGNQRGRGAKDEAQPRRVDNKPVSVGRHGTDQGPALCVVQGKASGPLPASQRVHRMPVPHQHGMEVAQGERSEIVPRCRVHRQGDTRCPEDTRHAPRRGIPAQESEELGQRGLEPDRNLRELHGK